MISASNLYPFTTSNETEILRQAAADRMLNRFQVAGMVSTACHVYGWLLHGPSPLSEQFQPESSAEMLVSGCSFEWHHPSQATEGYEVRLVLGDEPNLFVRHTDAEGWREISCELSALCRVLDEWMDKIASSRTETRL